MINQLFSVALSGICGTVSTFAQTKPKFCKLVAETLQLWNSHMKLTQFH